MKKQQYTYLLARLPMGLSFFGHGAIRIIKYAAFTSGMEKQFASSLLPNALVSPFAHVLPFVELLIGILLLAGLFTRFALVLAAILMMALIFGTAAIEQWQGIFTQLFYSAYLAVLFNYTNYNKYSVDGWRGAVE
jgi:thiosulfate dehydrogenase [quinone] large subunit